MGEEPRLREEAVSPAFEYATEDIPIVRDVGIASASLSEVILQLQFTYAPPPPSPSKMLEFYIYRYFMDFTCVAGPFHLHPLGCCYEQ